MDDTKEKIDVGTSFGTFDDSLKSLLVAPLSFQLITSSWLIVDFAKVDLIRKFQIGESSQTLAKK